MENHDLTFGINVLPTDKVGMIGYIQPVAREFEKQAAKVIIFDMGISQRNGNKSEICSMEEQSKLLPACDIVILSGTTMINNTIDGLLAMCTNAREIIMVGSSTPMFPQAFENSKITVLNIEIVLGVWPEVEIEPCDVAVAFYVGKIADDNHSLSALISSVKRGGIITSNGPLEDGGFYKSLAERLGVKSRNYSCRNGCYLRGKLEMHGCKVKCQQIEHEFGQPVNDTMEAAKFLCWQLQLDESYLDSVRNVVTDYMVKRDGKMYIPKLRHSCVIIYKK